MFNKYSDVYDLIYQDKDYYTESLFISELIYRYLPKINQIRLLDLACGTGLHAIELSKMGYGVDASDISVKMINSALEKALFNNVKIAFHNESFQTADRINKTFDVVISMFSSINYLISCSDLLKSFKNIHSLLQDGGIFIFDFWNGNAVIQDLAPMRVKRVIKGTKSVLRYSENTLDRINHIVNIKFSFLLFDNNKLESEFIENHICRYFFIKEMEDLLEYSGFKVIHKCPFLSPNQPIAYDDWNITFVAQKV